MTLWEPLPDTMGANARRLAVQLRRMKDRSGLTVPTLAARTAQSTKAWEGYLNGGKIPPRDAVEVLGQLCGADYERLGALWELAERGGGTEVPDPDPLDPLAPAEGLPKHHRWPRRLLTGGAMALLAAALGLIVMAGVTLDGGDAGGAQSPATVAPPSSRPDSRTPRTYPVSTPPGGTTPAPPRAVRPDTVTTTPVDPESAAATPSGAESAASPAPGGGATTAAPSTTASATPTPSPSASATSGGDGGGLCLGVIIIGVCIGG